MKVLKNDEKPRYTIGVNVKLKKGYLFKWMQLLLTGSVISKIHALHGAIDDATGKIVGLYLTKNECLSGILKLVKQILLNYGIPASLLY